MTKLFTEYNLIQLKLRNRIVMAPMCMYSSNEAGLVKDWHFIHYASRAVGGVGLILLEATGVENRGRITDRDLGLWKDEQIDGLAKIVQECKKHGAKVGIQLAHAGRKSEVIAEPSIAPSPIAFSDKYRVPAEMTKEEIKKVILAFGEAARRADLAGFDVIEIHAAHGYLISEFLSPLTNKRTDEYGGSEENRSRFLKEILQSVTKVWPKEKPILVRVSAEDYGKGGNHDDSIARMVNMVKDYGIDIVHVSSGGVVNVGMNVYPGYQVKYAETIKKECGLPVIAGGLITSPLMAEEVLQNERADLVFLGRELLRDPYWPLRAANELGCDIKWPYQYERAK
ncbi:NADPH dehydrogenase NamA [Mobilitalea sibirica]|uniref:NADPH dehydrogenase NamA n=1 Tax=Mobilitalea sibirica TaxID=1462919 RepID=A0A8J7KUU1_9FIRM|nr:NADPH dehydrogenase NamA [Mobilitalea sibirica]MBH1939385.1 NADPH dehydrogenase NamA [Mobilitalea sibirica]